ncbi:alpha/beta hydrolase [Lysinibacillus pakistanensis]|uniref:Alpha/beta hydrolase n=1 Tax=Lysinibacillus pakistanensis TaxID=759811 RepID=A0AAX3X1W8_9BACI|nr:alpha/beta hydrolase [Lysinibacillus pakistanensis]MDM5232538.1 alpha/beta hydrolase [Lysinibacillus pakistanensis]WHY48046.1 alpha/beta hydrolase [Lysinibacillus pakistanensis]WHY53058.1 alpha/beta hydrolase [Lysinibacillus pakistanensis]
MKNIKRILKYIGVIIILILLLVLFRPTWTSNIKGDNSISVLEQVKINGTKQQIMIRGRDQNNPVIIYVHGGPSVSEIPYAKYEDLLEKDFTVVNYDQRGSGKSYHFNEDYSNLTADVLVDDLLELTDYISKRFGKEKVILIGHSYGTYLGTMAAYKAPEKYEAYIGIGQVSNMQESEIDNLNYTISEAKKVGNTEDVKYLEGIAEKIHAGESVAPRGYVGKYGGATRLINMSDGDILLSREYNLLDFIRYNNGVAKTQAQLVKEIFDKPLPMIVTKLELPFYFVMGKYDAMTSYNAAKNYFDVMEADKKEFISFEQSAHYPLFEEKEKFYRWMCDTFK